MKQETRERTEKYSVWIASDGTEFKDKTECSKYEETAKCALLTRYEPLIINSGIEEDLFGFGSGDYEIDVVQVTSTQEADLITQLALLHNSYLQESSYKNIHDNVINAIKEATESNDYLFIGRGYDRTDFSVLYTRNKMIQRIQNACNLNN